MPTLSPDAIQELLGPYWPHPTSLLLNQLSTYLDLLVKWNARTNLTAIRDPQEMVKRHFGESLFAAAHLPSSGTLLDLGSGAGFPGLPLQLALPNLAVTLAESQAKKASFLREVVRTLGLRTEVWGARVEALSADRDFDVVTLRAVDDPGLALALARKRLAPDGILAHWTTASAAKGQILDIPGSSDRIVELTR